MASRATAVAIATRTVVGGDLDGNTLTFAVCESGRVRRVDEVTGSSPADAINKAIGRVAHAPMLVAWTARSGILRPLPFPAVPEDSRRAALDAVAEGAGIGGLVCGRLDGDHQVALVGGANSDEVAALWHGVSAGDLTIVLAPMVLSSDGCWVAVRRCSAELTVVEHGIARLHRTLSCGGLDVLASRLGASGWARLDAILRAAVTPDVDALPIVDDYVEQLCRQVTESLAFWRRSERLDLSAVYVHGIGSTLPTIEAHLSAAGIRAFAPPALAQASSIPAVDMASSFLAVQAAVADPATYLGFPDVAGLSRRAALTRAAAHTRKAVACAVVAAAAILALIAPIAQGALVRHQAAQRLASATATIHRLQAQEAIYTYVKAARQAWTAAAAAEPDWAITLGAIVKSAPGGAKVTTLLADTVLHPGSVAVTIEATGGDPSFADLQAWAGVLGTNPAVSNVFSTSASSRQTGGATFEVQFDIALHAVQNPRPFGGVG